MGGTGFPARYGAGFNQTQYNKAFQAGKNSLYQGMTPLQRSQANAVYNVTQPVSPTLQ
jgi:hypothetical protein